MPAQTGGTAAPSGYAAPSKDRHAVVQERIRNRRKKVPTLGSRIAEAQRMGRQPIERSGRATERTGGLAAPGAAVPGIGQRQQPGLGRQLTNLVDSGKFTQDKAEAVAKQRQLLRSTYGADWRGKILGGAGVIRSTRQQLQGMGDNPPGNEIDEGGERARLKKRLEQLLAKRREAVEGARTKVARKSARRFTEAASQ